MPPVNTSASSPDVDNEATAELPVLDVAAYESTMGERTDSWAAPSAVVEATTEMRALPDESIPTLQAVVPAYDLDHSGTHEMPAMPSRTRRKSALVDKRADESPASLTTAAAP